MRNPWVKSFYFPEKSENHSLLGQRMRREKRVEEVCRFEERGDCGKSYYCRVRK